MIALGQLNEASAAEFVVALEGVFEHSPWVAERAAQYRPFTSRLQLTDQMRKIVNSASVAAQLELIRAHPRLGARGRILDELTAESRREQRRAGLDALSDANYAMLLVLNDAYFAKFSFPFILAVRGHDGASILQQCASRLGNDAAEEHQNALQQIGLIGGYRLAERIVSDDAAEIAAMSARLAAAAAPGAVERQACWREWMLAAGLEIATDTRGELTGRLAGAGHAAESVVLSEPGEMLLGIIMAQRVRQKKTALVRDLCLGAHPERSSITMHWPAAGAASLEERLSLLEKKLLRDVAES